MSIRDISKVIQIAVDNETYAYTTIPYLRFTDDKENLYIPMNIEQYNLWTNIKVLINDKKEFNVSIK